MNSPQVVIANFDPAPWEEIQALLTGVRESLKDDCLPTEASDALLLKKRAKEYAVKDDRSTEIRTSLEDVLLFTLGSDTYAMPCEAIEEVIPMQNLVALPHTSKSILGISSNRGVLLAVVDLKRILNIPVSDLTTMHRVLVVRNESLQIGFLVDAIQGMRSIDKSKMKLLPTEFNERTQRFLQGISDGNVLVMNPIEVVNELAETASMTGNKMNNNSR